MQLSLPAVPSTPSASPSASGLPDGTDLRAAAKKATGVGDPAPSFDELMPDAGLPGPKTGKTTNGLPDQMAGETAVLFSGCMLLTPIAQEKAAPLAGVGAGSTPGVGGNGEGDEATTGRPLDGKSIVATAADATRAPAFDLAGDPVGRGQTGRAKGVLPTAAKLCDGTATAAGTLASTKIPLNGETEMSDDQVTAAMAALEVPPAALNPSKSGTVDEKVGQTEPSLVALTANAAVSSERAALPSDSTASRRSSVSGVARSFFPADSLNRSSARISSEGEKIAVAPTGSAREGNGANVSTNRNFLNIDEEEVSRDDKSLGTDAAKDVGSMAALTHRSTVSTGNPVLDSSAGVVKSPDAQATATTGADAHRAVDAVLAATERLGTSSTRAVNLQFSFGGADLAVRVEVRAGEVHATFRTNSAELRDSLSTEWHAAAAQDSASPLRMVEPVFRGSDSASLNNSTGESGTQQRNSDPRDSEQNTFASLFRGDSASTDEASSAAPRALQVSQPATSLRLHTFA